MGNCKAKLSSRGKSRGPRRGKGVARQRWGLGPVLWGHAGCPAAQRNRHWASPPPPPSLGTDRGWQIPGTHTYMNTHTHAHTLPYQPDNLVLKSRSSSESQPSPSQCLAWTIDWPGKHLVLRDASWDLVVGRVLSTASQPGTGWPMALWQALASLLLAWEAQAAPPFRSWKKQVQRADETCLQPLTGEQVAELRLAQKPARDPLPAAQGLRQRQARPSGPGPGLQEGSP